MSKIDNLIINNLKEVTLSLAKDSNDKVTSFDAVKVFYSLFLNHYNYNPNDLNWINRDRIVFANEYIKEYYSVLSLAGLLKEDSLKEYKKLNSNTPSYASNVTPLVELNSINNSDILSLGLGISIGECYLENLLDIEIPKDKLIDFNTYVVLNAKNILNGSSFEAINYIKNNDITKLIPILLSDDNNISDDIKTYFKNNKITVYEVSNDLEDIDEAIEDAKKSKRFDVVLINIKQDKEEIKIDIPYLIKDEYKNHLKDVFNKRIAKVINKWESVKKDYISNNKVKKIINFLAEKKTDINFDISTLKINDNYNEELYKGNNKIFNVVASKSEFILNVYYEDDNSLFIKSSKEMNIDNPLGRNINLKDNLNLIATIPCALSYLGFKVFVSLPLIYSNNIRSYIKYGVSNKLDINYVFTYDTLLNTYNSAPCNDEVNNLRIIPNLINFRPCDINEIIGAYGIVANSNNTNTIIIGSEKRGIISGTNPKYVVAGLYRIKREVGEANGVLITSGTEIDDALRVCEELIPYGIDLRVVSASSYELFEHQSDRYKMALLPEGTKVFILDYSTPSYFYKYTKNIIGLNDYPTCGTKEELLNNYNLDIDSIKTRIIEEYKK